MESHNNVSFEYICLKCNQLFTSKDLFKHLQYLKDHVDTCIHIDDIKKQLSNISHSNYPNNSYNNNIFKKRIETIWSELKSLSSSYTNLNTKSKEISDHFENLHNQLIIREHSLKKQIKDDINLISCDIIHQINELKSILNIINQNNNNKNNDNNNDNNNSSEDSDIESSDSENQDKYKITSIINSINRSKHFNRFISDNKNTLFNNNINRDEGDNIEFITILNNIINFNKEFNSSLSNPTNLYSQSSKLKIDSDKYIVRINQDCNEKFKTLIEESIRVDVSPSVLVRIGDFQQLKDYFNRNNIIKLDVNQLDIKQTIIETLKSNRIDIFDYLFKELHFSIKSKNFRNWGEASPFRQFEYSLLDFAIINSNSETIKYIETVGINNNIKWDYSKALELSPLTNSISMLQYFASKELGIAKPNDIYVSANAILKGHIEMVQWISQNTPFTFIYRNQNAIDLAASHGHLEIIKWLHHNRTEGCKTHAMDRAAMNGYLDIMKWLHENRTEGCSVCAMDDAASYGHFETVKWLHENRTEGCTTEAMDEAARHGHFEIIKWLHENRTEGCTTKTMDNAAVNGHFEIVKWLHENRTEGCSTFAMDEAAEYGHFEIVKWLHHNRTEGCTTNAMDYAAMKGHLKMVKWFHFNRTEGCSEDAMDYAAMNGHFETIKWLHFNRTEGCSADAMDYAAMNGHFEIVKWLHENRTEGCTSDGIEAMENARNHKRMEIVKWFEENRNDIRIVEIQI